MNTTPTPLKKISLPIILSMLFVSLLVFNSCKKKRTEMGNSLFNITKNKVFKQADPDAFAEVFKKVIADQQATMPNAAIVTAYYEGNDYDPVFVMDHLSNGDLDALSARLNTTNDHGLDPKLFQSDTVRSLLAKFHDKNGIKTLNEGYEDMAKLELLTASQLIKYSNALQFGVISPRKIYARYFTATKRPDTASMANTLKVTNIKTYLDSIQPKDPQYLAIQKALKDSVQAPGLSKEESKRYFIVNLERLRWKNKPTEAKYVFVNIPDYKLDVMENGKSVLNMKVCVGEGRNKDHDNSLVEYDDSDKTDRPFSRETPQLNSMIHSVQVNPVWNIPQSIASKEIMVEAAKDPYYLSNKNIDVYKDGKVVDDAETIDWSSANKDEYSFKQRPGDDNSLGKIKFLFNNSSSVYLHDTPAKAAFNQAMRAVSHGCVRLGDPQGLAQNLFGEGDDYNTIVKDMSEDNPKPTDIGLPTKVPIYITYITCWADESGILQYRPDVYGLDIVLFAHLQKLMGA